MTKLSISQAARAYSKDRKTISRHINEGKLSCEVNTQGHKLIDMAELVRAYGEPKQNASPAPMRYDASLPQHDTPDASPFLEEKITLLGQQIGDLKKDKGYLQELLDSERAERQQLLLLLEDKREKPEITPESENESKDQRWLVWGLVAAVVVLSIVTVISLTHVDDVYGLGFLVPQWHVFVESLLNRIF